MDWFSVHLATRAPESLDSEAQLDGAGDRLMDLWGEGGGAGRVGRLLSRQP